MKTRKTRVYVAGPYSAGDTVENVRAAVKIANNLMDAGFLPFTPHLSHLHHIISPRNYEDWLKYDFDWLEVCDVLYRFSVVSEGGSVVPSPGADREVDFARERNIPVVYTMRELYALMDPITAVEM